MKTQLLRELNEYFNRNKKSTKIRATNSNIRIAVCKRISNCLKYLKNFRAVFDSNQRIKFYVEKNFKFLIKLCDCLNITSPISSFFFT